MKQLPDVLKGSDSLRVLIFMESDDRTHFHQVVLSREEYKKVGQIISKPCDDPTHDHPKGSDLTYRTTNLRPDRHIHADHFLGLEAVYTRKEIEEIDQRWNEGI